MQQIKLTKSMLLINDYTWFLIVQLYFTSKKLDFKVFEKQSLSINVKLANFIERRFKCSGKIT